MKVYFAVGTYTEPILFGTGELFQGKGMGIAICELSDGKIRVLKEIKLQNPSFLCIDEKLRKIYAVNELKEYDGEIGGGITQLAYDEYANMVIERAYGTIGSDPCHIAKATNGKMISIANFADGSVTIFPLDANGNMLKNNQFFQHKGGSIHPVRQKGPHAHSVIFTKDNNYMMVPDLGLDKVIMYHVDGSVVESKGFKDYRLPDGSGPRFGEFDRTGQNFYLINELESNVMHCSYEEGRLNNLGVVNTLPDEYLGDNICSDLHLTPDGKFLYASNRGHDSLACFKVKQDGGLTLIGHNKCGGKTPRNFAITPLGDYLLVGNQDSDNITVFKIEEGGKLFLVEQWYVGSPVCIRFFEDTTFKI